MVGWHHLMQWTWTWANFGRWWGIGRPGVLQPIGSQRTGYDWVTEQQHPKNKQKKAWYLFSSHRFLHKGIQILKWPNHSSLIWTWIFPSRANLFQKKMCKKFLTRGWMWLLVSPLTFSTSAYIMSIVHISYGGLALINLCEKNLGNGIGEA